MTRFFLVVAGVILAISESFVGAFFQPVRCPTAPSPRRAGSSTTSGYLAAHRVAVTAACGNTASPVGARKSPCYQHASWNRCSTATYSGRGVLAAAASSDDEDSIENPAQESHSSEPTTPSTPAATPPLSSSSSRPLDPLFVAVTRMDETTASAPTVSVPIWGDLILDRSLFVFLPLLGFGLGGIVLSLYIVFNSGDALVDAMAENAVWQSSGGGGGGGGGGESITTTVDGPAACRGLCSSQEQDLQGLREYMSRFAKSTPAVSTE